MISLHCPSTIMGRSAADGNHMPAGLTSPSQSLSKGSGDEDERRGEDRKVEAQSRRGEQCRKVRGAQRDGGGMRGVEVER